MQRHLPAPWLSGAHCPLSSKYREAAGRLTAFRGSWAFAQGVALVCLRFRVYGSLLGLVFSKLAAHARSFNPQWQRLAPWVWGPNSPPPWQREPGGGKGLN